MEVRDYIERVNFTIQNSILAAEQTRQEAIALI